MRVQPSAVLQAQMRTLGAIPKVMDFSAAYQALKSGPVDGTENPASNFYTQQYCAVKVTPGGQVAAHSSFGGGQLLALAEA